MSAEDEALVPGTRCSARDGRTGRQCSRGAGHAGLHDCGYSFVIASEPDPLSGREYCPRCSSGPRQPADVDECPDCGYPWSGPRLLGEAPPS